ncbi:hypothetical protein CDD81_7714 [Ophiocordyceps australis]|uniref:Uncharacterized protein n=1 Tax=Ophiocordyceps australis TaxID=1399860 RepID=A0A2C5XXI9_9HYPO|nr:hypothetical protein CDD81_7714 [Ophiocordyceps australis]
MRTTSLLLGAAASVSAIIGGEVYDVMLSDTTFFCADNCLFGGGFFQQNGPWCLASEVVALVDKDPAKDQLRFLACNGTANPQVWRERALKPSDRQPEECWISEVDPEFPQLRCSSNRSGGSGGKNTKPVAWSELQKMLETATAGAKEKEAAPKKAAPQPPLPGEDRWVWA